MGHFSFQQQPQQGAPFPLTQQPMQQMPMPMPMPQQMPYTPQGGLLGMVNKGPYAGAGKIPISTGRPPIRGTSGARPSHLLNMTVRG